MQDINVTDAAQVPIKGSVSAEGAGDKVSVSMVSYDINATAGDEYVMEVQNTTGANDIVIYDASIFIEETHF